MNRQLFIEIIKMIVVALGIGLLIGMYYIALT